MEPEQIDNMYRKAEKLAHEALDKGTALETAIEKMGSAISMLEKIKEVQTPSDDLILELACYTVDQAYMQMHQYCKESRYFNAHIMAVKCDKVLGSIMPILDENCAAPAAVRMRAVRDYIQYRLEDSPDFSNQTQRFLYALENETDEEAILRNKIDMAKHSLEQASKRDDQEMAHMLSDRIKKMQKDLIKRTISS